MIIGIPQSLDNLPSGDLTVRHGKPPFIICIIIVDYYIHAIVDYIYIYPLVI